MNFNPLSPNVSCLTSHFNTNKSSNYPLLSAIMTPQAVQLQRDRAYVCSSRRIEQYARQSPSCLLSCVGLLTQLSNCESWTANTCSWRVGGITQDAGWTSINVDTAAFLLPSASPCPRSVISGSAAILSAALVSFLHFRISHRDAALLTTRMKWRPGVSVVCFPAPEPISADGSLTMIEM